MTATLLDGKALAETVRAEVRTGVEAFTQTHKRPPGLDVVLVGDNAASRIYTRNKEKASKEVGMRGRLHTLAETTSQDELLALLALLANDPEVDGILVQLPLPSHLAADRVLDAVPPEKDVDGFHPVNVGLLALGRPALVPCTPLGCMRLLAQAGTRLRGARAVVIGRSTIVGKPMAQLLLAEHATVTIAHSRTQDLPALCREADVLVAAIGKAEMVQGDWIKPGATVLDVGINRVTTSEGKSKLVGDVCFDEAKECAGLLSPVPGGVGPMTIACLLQNTLTAARRRLER